VKPVAIASGGCSNLEEVEWRMLIYIQLFRVYKKPPNFMDGFLICINLNSEPFAMHIALLFELELVVQ